MRISLKVIMPFQDNNIPLTLELINLFYWASIAEWLPFYEASVSFFAALFPVFMLDTKKLGVVEAEAAELKDIESLSQVVTHKRGLLFVTGKGCLRSLN